MADDFDPNDLPDDLPSAHRFEVFRCANCPHLHVLFFDEEDEVILQAVISDEQAKGIAAFAETPPPEGTH